MESLENMNTSVNNKFVWNMTASILGRIYPLAAKPAAYIFVREDSDSKFSKNLYIPSRLHKVTSEKTVMFTIVFVRTS